MYLPKLVKFMQSDTLPTFSQFMELNASSPMAIPECRDKTLICMICGGRKYHFQAYESCIRTHLLQQAFLCEFCGKSCSDNRTLDAHYASCKKRGNFFNTNHEQNTRHLAHFTSAIINE
jgi:hypothetical protein